MYIGLFSVFIIKSRYVTKSEYRIRLYEITRKARSLLIRIPRQISESTIVYDIYEIIDNISNPDSIM